MTKPYFLFLIFNLNVVKIPQSPERETTIHRGYVSYKKKKGQLKIK